MPEPTPTVSATNTDNSTAAPTITDTATTQPTPNNSGLTWVYIAMGAVVVIGVIAIVLILGKKKT
jgi:Na+/proline symporter